MTYIIIIAVIILLYVFLSQNDSHTYNAKFGSNWEHLSRFNQGFSISGAKAITQKLSYENCALFGPTGSGKTTTIIIPSAVSLAKGKSSIIFNDVSGEVYERTSSFLAHEGYKILRLDFSNSSKSETFNPLLECKSISDIQKVALLVVRNSIGQSKSDPFWENGSILLISLFARYLVFHTEPEFCTLQNVL